MNETLDIDVQTEREKEEQVWKETDRQTGNRQTDRGCERDILQVKKWNSVESTFM